MEFLLVLLPGRLLVFLIAGGFIAAGVYGWISGNEARAEYDIATGNGSKTYQAEVRRKVIRQESSSGVNDYDPGTVDVNYLSLSYTDESGEYQSTDAQVERDEYDKTKEGDKIKISFHPDNPKFVVTPMTERPGVFWYRVFAVIFIGLGVIFVLMLLVSLAE